jgi:Ras-related GTP-binding protein A/B
MARKKVLLMGKAHSGKTSMRSIIFANYLARDTMRLSPTLDVEHHHVRFLGDLVLNLWDCGGQDAFYESYFERDRETIFKSVELLIYVFDIASECPEKDFDHFAGVLEAIEENSPDARIFVLVHKMDLVAKEEQEMILEDRRRLIEESCISCGVHNFQCFGTSIWDETLYKAWSEIVRYLIPNIDVLQSHLNDFCRVCDADEVVLFEKATFLVISHSTAAANANTSTAARTPAGNNANDTLGINDAVGSDAHAYEVDINTATTTNTTPKDQEDEMLNISTEFDDHGGTVLDHHNEASKALNSNNLADETEDDHTYTESVPAPISNIDTTEATSMDEVDANADAHDTYSEVTTEKDLGAGGAVLDGTVTNNQNDANATGTSPSPGQFDTHRFEKISNIVKQFKLSCEKAQSQFQGMEVSNSKFSAFIDAFTANTYIMVIVSRRDVHTAATLMNIKNARSHFERFIPRS